MFGFIGLVGIGPVIRPLNSLAVSECFGSHDIGFKSVKVNFIDSGFAGPAVYTA